MNNTYKHPIIKLINKLSNCTDICTDTCTNICTDTCTDTDTDTNDCTDTCTNICTDTDTNDCTNTCTSTNNIVTFEDIKTEFKKKDNNGECMYHIGIKESDDLLILYHNDAITSDDNFIKELEISCRSLILDKTSLKIIASQFNKISYNDEAVRLLENICWNNITIQKCYEGTTLIVFNHNNKWHVSTRRCINSEKSSWVKNKSYREMFDEAMDGKFIFEDLDESLCYHFVLVHYRNRNIIDYSSFGNDYKELFHILTTKKYTLDVVERKINNINYIDICSFPDLSSLLRNLKSISQQNEYNHKITTEGYVLRVYDNDEHTGKFTVFKLQTDIYQKLIKIKPNNSNIHQVYLELYQTDLLVHFLPYFTKYSIEITKRLHSSMRTVAKEILNIYHSTRLKKNPDIYNDLNDQYKKILYGLHGLYMQYRKTEFIDNDTGKITKSINVHDVYNYLKQLPPCELRQIFYERMLLLDNCVKTLLITDCIYTKTQSTLMFQHFINKQ